MNTRDEAHHLDAYEVSIPLVDSMPANFLSTPDPIPEASRKAERDLTPNLADPFLPNAISSSIAVKPLAPTSRATMVLSPVSPNGQPSLTSLGPVLAMTLLLTSGKRHPYKIDERYLSSRNVTIPGTTEDGKKDPYSISVYTLKELILREWRDEWELQPSSPSSIRLIFFGRLLDDNTALLNCRLNKESSNVIHMTVRPQDLVDDEDASKGKILSKDRDNGDATAGCRCAIM
ncbi:BgTH12-04822 [Blumeria graminis f. sp. triticale]|uniref:Ubiquitin-like domain-containing protein n=4 Tax=Blumeria graminis TaxID=34373 RepID=A0A656KK65_BLUGR|nr:hypothetical protein BGT96224_1102 [Blumeria graminis f. sp. tritici 96224]CAD6499170.1 BgTH12-04822 [Blumeria graminis f. sp. triticale]VCU39285.1 Bgt-1102 [Blumeria graminis f. sp. tritici]